MKYINNINLNESKVELVAMFVSAFTDKLEAMGIDPKDAIVSLCAETPKNEAAESCVKAILANYCAGGFMFNGNVHQEFCAPASKVRQATAMWLRTDLLSEIGSWAMCGLRTKTMKLAINKFMAYIGLLFSASKKFVDVFGIKIDIRRVAVIKDAEVVIEAVTDYVAESNDVSHEVARRMVVNAFDGFGIIRDKITKGESVTIRGPWIKAFVQAVNWSKLVAFCAARGIKMEFVDFWGNTIALKDVDIILTESCFKTAKLYESWDQYCTAFEALGHDIRVCVREHAPKLKGMPYQQGQTLMGNEDDALHFMQHAKSTVWKYTNQKNAVDLLRGYHKQAAKMYPAMMNEAFTKRSIQEKYTTKRNDMLGGRIPELGYNAFLAPDPVAFVEHLFGLPIKGFLKAGECFCAAAEASDIDVTRSPHLDNAHVILENVASCPFAEGPTMFINIWDTTTIQLRADYDGDHVWWSQDEYLLELVKRTYETLKNIPIDWDVCKAEKVSITRSAIATFVINLIHGSEIGLYADALTKMWNTKYDRDVCDWLTYAGNVLIDAAKHGSIKINKPDAVKALNQVSLPLFAMYAKANEKRPIGPFWTDERYTCTKSDNVVYKSQYTPEKHGEIKNVRPPRCAYSGSFLDMYSKKIEENIPEVLEIEGLDDEIFDVTSMMIDAHRKIGNFSGLSKKGIYNPETNSFIGCGIFQEIAFRHSTEWNKLVGDTSFFANRREWEEETGRAARKEIVDWAYAQYPEIARSEEMDKRLDDACYDIITRHIFNTKMSDGMNEVIMQAFWRIYGDKAVKVLKTNLNTSIPDFDSEEYDELLDDSND